MSLNNSQYVEYKRVHKGATYATHPGGGGQLLVPNQPAFFSAKRGVGTECSLKTRAAIPYHSVLVQHFCDAMFRCAVLCCAFRSPAPPAASCPLAEECSHMACIQTAAAVVAAVTFITIAWTSSECLCKMQRLAMLPLSQSAPYTATLAPDTVTTACHA
jgi:hypothetical protein